MNDVPARYTASHLTKVGDLRPGDRFLVHDQSRRRVHIVEEVYESIGGMCRITLRDNPGASLGLWRDRVVEKLG